MLDTRWELFVAVVLALILATFIEPYITHAQDHTITLTGVLWESPTEPGVGPPDPDNRECRFFLDPTAAPEGIQVIQLQQGQLCDWFTGTSGHEVVITITPKAKR